MLVLSRRTSERVRIMLPDGRPVWVTVVETKGKIARLGFTADRDIPIMREEHVPEAERLPQHTPQQGDHV